MIWVIVIFAVALFLLTFSVVVYHVGRQFDQWYGKAYAQKPCQCWVCKTPLGP